MGFKGSVDLLNCVLQYLHVSYFSGSPVCAIPVELMTENSGKGPFPTYFVKQRQNTSTTITLPPSTLTD